MIKGKRINPHPTIGIVSLSAPEALWNPDVYKQGKNALLERGCRVIESETLFSNYYYLSNSPDKIAESLHKMFANPEVDMIMCAGGGNCMNKTLPYLDFNFIRQNYKPFVGISDITALLLALQNEDMVPFHGPFVLWNYGVDDTPTAFTHDNLISTLQGDFGQLPCKTEWKVFQSGYAEGKIIGGNISTITNVAGTKYCPVELFEDSILFIEDIAEGYPSLDSKLTHLNLLGIFNRLKGVVFGKMPECQPPEEQPDVSLLDFISLTFNGYDFPIIYDCDFGHVPDNLCLPLGCQIALDASKDSPIITLKESGVL